MVRMSHLVGRHRIFLYNISEVIQPDQNWNYKFTLSLYQELNLLIYRGSISSWYMSF